MTPSLWFLGARFSIIADAATTGGQYNLIERRLSPIYKEGEVKLEAVLKSLVNQSN